ncbi:MAG: tetratricopeptide repeat protein [Flavobacteriales bacterium]|nr:tetratricopeptide repeat protein [Flavobacteriales bacterium]
MGAREDYDRALELDPGYLEAQYDRAFVRKQLGDHAGAFIDAEMALKNAPNDADAWNMKGSLHLLYGEYAAAIECFDRALSINGMHTSAWFNRGMAKHMTYRPNQGCDDLRRSAELGNEKAREALSYFCAN